MFFFQKLKRYLLLFFVPFLIYLPEKSYAQKFHFSDTSNVWSLEWFKYHDGTPWQSTFTCQYNDSSITENGLTYLVLTKINGGSEREVMIREDTLNQKVYAKFKPDEYNNPVGHGHEVTDTNEFVLYDYLLNIGDTLKMPLTLHPLSNISYHVLIGLDSITINGIGYKVQEFGYSWTPTGGFFETYKVVEGIGSLAGPISVQPITNFESNQQLYCFENNGVYPVLSSPIQQRGETFSNRCIPYHLSIYDGIIDPDIWRIYPNPSRDRITITADDQKIRIKIYDAFGSPIYKSEQYQIKAVIDAGHWNAGLYIIEVEDTKGKRGRRKLQIAD